MFNLNITDDAKLYIQEDIDPVIILTMNGQQYARQISGIKNLCCLDTFTDKVSGESDINKLIREYRLSLDGTHWSDWFLLEKKAYNVDYNNSEYYEEIGSVSILNEDPSNKYKFSGLDFSTLDHSMTYYLEIRWTKVSLLPNQINIYSYEIEGCWDRATSYKPINGLTGTDYLYIRYGNLLKAFNITGFNIDADGMTGNRTLSIDYRFSQDSGRTWTNWEPLTNGNISSVKFSRVKFFLPEFRVKRTGDTSGVIILYDIELLGDIQNVSKDYLKVNKLGLRECCCIVDANGNELETIVNNNDLTGAGTASNTSGGDSGLLMGLNNCDLPDIFKYPLTFDNVTNLFKPYELDKAVQLYSSLSTISTQIFGFDVTYFATEPDYNGQDHTFHEYQLYNVVCVSDLKVTVEENNFPDNQIVFNQFDLSLFETFEIQITKDMFHKAFGISRRPSKEDFLWFCELNRMYQVEHSQVKRDFNNAGVYYRVILKKYTQKANIKPANSTVEDRVKALTRNSTLDELMGVEKKEDKLSIANKEQLRTLTHDRVRDKIYASIDRELIDNSSLIVARDHYALDTITYGNVAVVYNSEDPKLHDYDNRSITAWFNVNNFYLAIKEFVVVPFTLTGTTGPSASVYTYSVDNTIITYSYVTQSINIIDNYDSINSQGYKINLNNTNRFDVNINSYTFSMPVAVTDSVWYCYVANIDQRNGLVNQYLYKRNITNEADAIKLRSSKLLLLTSSSVSMAERQQFEIDYDMNILASDSKLTNIRIFNDIIDPAVHDKVLNQQIVRDSQYLILADNANKIMKAKNYPYN